MRATQFLCSGVGVSERAIAGRSVRPAMRAKKLRSVRVVASYSVGTPRRACSPSTVRGGFSQDSGFTKGKQILGS